MSEGVFRGSPAADAENPHLVDGKYSIRDLADVERLRRIFQKFSESTRCAIGLDEYPSEEVLIATGWQDACVKFHRCHPESALCCLKSNMALNGKLQSSEDMVIELCGNGLVDGAIPIVIKGTHVATLLTGQIFFEPPDMEKFSKRSQIYGYDGNAYLDAIRRVPVVPRDQFEKTLSFLWEIACLITELGYRNIEIREKTVRLEKEISEREHRTGELREINRKIELYQRLVEFTGDGVYIYTFDEGRVLFANRGFVNILNLDLSPQELAGKFLKDILIYTEEPGSVRRAAREKNEIHNYEYHFKTLKGEDRWVIHNSCIVQDEQTGAQVVEAIVKDITERKKADAALRASEESFRALAENANDAILIVSGGGELVYANKRMAQITGYTIGELQALALQDLVHSDERERMAAYYQKRLNDEVVPIQYEMRMKRKGGETLPVEISGAKTVWHGRAADIVIVRDITERKKIEEFKDEIVKNVSHELRTPMHAMREGISILLDGLAGEITEEQEEMLKTAKANLDRLVRLVNSFLDFQRLEARIFQLNFHRADINGLVEQVQKTMKPLARNKGLAFELQLDPELPEIECDRDRIVQVLINLFDNALKFTESGTIIITTSKNEDEIMVSVRDTGIGIRAEDQPRLFRKFGQLESGKAAAVTGTGLGLVISKNIIELHKGRIWVESRFEEGSIFSFSLPRTFEKK